MRIDALRIQGFGRLADEEFVFPSGKVALIVDNNETGKSTLAAALLYGLCDLPPAKGAGPKGGLRADKVYRPWNGGQFGLQLDITASGRELTITRDFETKTSTITDRRTGKDVTSEFSFGSDLASHFLGLPRDDFERIAFVRGKDAHKFEASAGMRSRLSSIVEDSPSGAEEALQALQSVKVRLDAGGELKPESALSRLTNAIADNERKIAKLEGDLASGEYQALLDMRSKLEKLDSEITDLACEKASARLRELQDKLASADSNANELAQLEEEAASLDQRRHEYAVAPHDSDLQEIAVALSEAANALVSAQKLQGQVSTQEDRFRSEGIDVSATVQFTEKMAALNAEDAAFLTQLNAYRISANAKAVESDAAANSARSKLETLQSGRKAASRTGKGLAVAGGLAAVVVGVLFAVGQLGSIATLTVGMIAVLAVLAGVVWSMLAQSKGSDEVAQFAIELKTAEEKAQAARDEIKVSEDRLARMAVAMGYSDAASLNTDLDRWDRARDRIKPLLDARDSMARENSAALSAENRARSLFTRLGLDATNYTRQDLERKRDELSAYLKIIARLVQLREERIPEAKGRVISGEDAKKTRDEIAQIASNYGDNLSEPSHTVAEAEQLARSLSEERKRLSDDAGKLETSIAAEVEAYRREYPGLLEETARLKRKEASIRQFDSAAKLAAETLKEVSEESRRKWADALNSGSTAILQRFCPAYDTFLFDDNLDFTVRSIESGKQLQKAEIDNCLSTGAKDQLYIAFKLACCDELSRDQESLPVILDDPLIASDDTRFADALDYILSDYATRHQVIILTCHRARHEQALARSEFVDRCVVLGCALPTTA